MREETGVSLSDAIENVLGYDEMMFLAKEFISVTYMDGDGYGMDEEDNILDIFIISYIISGDSDLFISKLGLDLDSIEYLKEQNYLKYPFK